MNVMNKNLIYLIFIIFPFISFSQEVQWATRVIGVSTQAGLKEFSAIQALGKPNVMPNFGFSACSWMPSRNSKLPEEWIFVSFDFAMVTKKIIIAENYNPGLITKIYLYDSLYNQYLVYQNTNPRVDSSKGRIWNLTIPTTPYMVKALKLVIENKQNLPVQIDAIGIMSSNEEYQVTIKTSEAIKKIGNPENLGPNINSEYAELAPLISPDGRTLFFTRDEHPQNVGKEKKQDIWYSEIDSNGNFSLAKPLGPPINNEYNNFAVSITPDGNSLVVGNTYLENGTVGPGVSISYKQGNQWSFPKPLIIRDYVNKNKMVSYWLANDGKTLLLSIEPDDTYGNSDIYVSFLQEDGTWSTPLNLGPMINTAGSETTPFLASDGVTLFFSSNGYPGYGKNDLFITQRLDNTWTNWKEPENIGPIINSLGWDAYYTSPASGEYAYFVSSKNSYGFTDIFRLLLPEELRPKTVVLIYGKVINKKTNEPLEAKISYEVLPEGKEVGIARSNPLTGEYKIVLPAGNKYGFLAIAEGFIAINENLDLKNTYKYYEIKRDLYLVPIEHGQSIRLNNIFFEFAKYDLLEDSYSELNRVYDFMLKNPNIKIKIAGHTDNVGSKTFNQNLSEKRAKAVADYLISKGIDKKRIQTIGYGMDKPIASNETEEGRQQNRRVEFIILTDK
mgnify:CR=1 FL=1